MVKLFISPIVPISLRILECFFIKTTPVASGGGGGGTLIFSYTGRLWSFFGVQNFKLFILVFRENEYFVGHKDFVDIFWGHHKIGLYLGIISLHFRVFS